MSTKLNTAHSERLELLPCGAQNFFTKGCASAVQPILPNYYIFKQIVFNRSKNYRLYA